MAEQRPEFVVDGEIITQGHLEDQWRGLEFRSGPEANLIAAQHVISVQTQQKALRAQVEAIFEKGNTGPGIAELDDKNLLDEYQLVLRRTGYLKTLKEFEAFYSLKLKFQPGEFILDGDDVYSVAQQPIEPTIVMNEPGAHVENPARYLSWRIPAFAANGELSWVLVDEFTPIGTGAILAKSKEALNWISRDSHMTIGAYEKHLGIFESLGAEKEIERLKNQAARDALRVLRERGQYDYSSDKFKNLELLELSSPEDYQDLLDARAKRIAEYKVPEGPEMIFYAGYALYLASKEGAEIDPYNDLEPKVVFDLYLKERERGLALIEHERLVEEASVLAA